jgi:hypothetical protein
MQGGINDAMPPFIPPMGCERLTNPARLVDRAWIAGPKLGQRAQCMMSSGNRGTR